MRPSQGDIVLIPIPFTDLSSHKQRPIIVISNDAYNRNSPDMVVVAMTSNPTPGPYSFTLISDNLVRGKLNRPGTVRVDKIYTLDQQLSRRIFGQVSTDILDRISQLLDALTAQSP